VLKGAEARDGVEGSERLTRNTPRVVKVDVEPVTAAGRGLGRGQGDADPGRADAPDVVQQPAPPAAEVEYATTGFEAELLGDIVVLAALCLLQAQGKIAVELGSAEIGELSETEPDDAVSQRIGEIKVFAISAEPVAS
jgi:hypothetical protein